MSLLPILRWFKQIDIYKETTFMRLSVGLTRELLSRRYVIDRVE